MGLQPTSFLFLVVRPGATCSVLAPSSDALCLVLVNALQAQKATSSESVPTKSSRPSFRQAAYSGSTTLRRPSFPSRFDHKKWQILDLLGCHALEGYKCNHVMAYVAIAIVFWVADQVRICVPGDVLPTHLSLGKTSCRTWSSCRIL